MNYLFLLETASDLCQKTKVVWTIFGYIVWAIKIAVPLLLIISGMIVMAKAVMSKEEKEIKSAQQHLIKKVIAAVIVYLIISLTGVVVGLVGGPDWENDCYDCVLHPFKTGCGIISDGSKTDLE